MKLIDRYFIYTPEEIKDFLITSVVFSLILFFFAWRTTDYNIITAIVDLIQFLIIVTGSLFIFISAAKIFAIQRHYTAHYTAWITAMLIGFVVSFTTYGFIPLLFPGLIEVQRIDRLRHGKVFPGENTYDIFTILAAAPLMSILLSVIMQFLFAATQLSFFYYTMVFNASLAFFSLLPFTKNIGSHLFYTNKKNYVFLLLFSFSFFILTIFNIYFSVVFGVLLAILLWFILKKPLQVYNL